MAETIYVSGLKEVLAKLKKLGDEMGDKTERRVVASALRKAGKVLQTGIQNRLRSRGHVKTGTLVENIIVTAERNPAPGHVSMNVTVRSRAKKYKDTQANRRNGRVGGSYKDYGPLFYARFLEFGTSHQQADPFMRPEFEEKKAQLPDMIRDDLSQKLDKALE